MTTLHLLIPALTALLSVGCLFIPGAYAFHVPIRPASSHVSLLRSQSATQQKGSLSSSSVRLYASASDASSEATSSAKTPLNVAIVGAGPSGLLLAHRLLSAQNIDATISIFEARPDYRQALASGSSRAYALGLGPRSRTAIKSVDAALWEQVSARGFACDRFTLHVNPKIKLRLRDGLKKLPQKFGGPSTYPSFEEEVDEEKTPEPSILIYQTDLCAALVDGLVQRYGVDSSKFNLQFDTRVSEVDVEGGFLSIQTEKYGPDEIIGPFDFVAGCGGVNSPVRDGIASAAPKDTFKAEERTLPGEFKVVRIPKMPPLLDPTSVALVLPSKPKKDEREVENENVIMIRGSTMSAFVEPVSGGGACVLFAGRGGGDGDEGNGTANRKESILSDWRLESFGEGDIDAIGKAMLSRFPLLQGVPKKDVDSMIQQLLSQRPGVAAAVKCNAYHYKRATIVGDAAHATGGVSGQGVNSALIDSAVLAECIDAQFSGIGSETDAEKEETLSSALLAYSKRQVPEGIALYDLSFGPTGELGLLGRLRVLLSTVRDTLFGGRFGVGKPLLQVQLSQSLRPFADIRRDRSEYYDVPFPSGDEFEKDLEILYDQPKSLAATE